MSSVDIHFVYYFNMRSNVISVSVCLSGFSLSVCLLAYLEKHVQIAPNFLYMLPVAMARSSPESNAICQVLLVMWMAFSYNA